MLAAGSNSSISKDAGPPSVQNPAPASSVSVEAKAQRVENGTVTAQHGQFTSKYVQHPTQKFKVIIQGCMVLDNKRVWLCTNLTILCFLQLR